jgi:hypothetical protein
MEQEMNTGSKTDSIKEYLKDHPDAMFVDFIRDTGINCAPSTFRIARTSFRTGMGIPSVVVGEKYGRKLITAVLDDLKCAWVCDCGNEGESTIKSIKASAFCNKCKHLATIKQKPVKLTNTEKVLYAVLEGAVEAPEININLKEENAFLMWWNQGERRGWVARLLVELVK